MQKDLLSPRRIRSFASLRMTPIAVCVREEPKQLLMSSGVPSRTIPIKAGEDGSIHLNGIPEILQPKIFVRGVLVVIVIRDRYPDNRRVILALK